MKKKHLATALLTISIITGLGALAIVLFINGFIHLNYPSFTEYPVQGIDISNHQKEIDWNKINKKRVQFALIKATEGGDFKDKSFVRNWNNAKKLNIAVGAYHFFTFCRSGEDQAKNYIESVPNDSIMLPPAIDLEYSGNCKTTKNKEELLKEISIFIQIIEEHYNRRMIIYATEDFYKNVLADKFTDNYLWIRDIYTKPKSIYNGTWTFWQFNNRGRFEGIETLVDMNVFHGNRSELEALLKARIKADE